MSRLKRWKLSALFILAGGLLLLAVVIGPHVGDDIVALENWIDERGPWAPVVFVALTIVLTSIFVPDSLLAVMAGMLFGIVGGTLVMVLGVVTAQCFSFGLSRHLLRDVVHQQFQKRPRFAAIENAINREGLRLLLLIRLTPLNPTMVSYVMGVTRTRLFAFLCACVGLVPSLFVEVYCGYTAKHVLKVAGRVHEHSPLQTVMLIVGLAACVLLFAYISRIAGRAIHAAEDDLRSC